MKNEPFPQLDVASSSSTGVADAASRELQRVGGHSDAAGSRGRGVLAGSGQALASGRIRLLRELGRGGFGVVYEAFDAERQERIALKLLSFNDPEGIYRFKNEFRSLAGIRHENLVRLYELFSQDEDWFLTMECVEGEPFDSWVRPFGALDEGRLRAALAQLSAAVAALHAGSKLHRDLKPSNVLVTPQGRVVVLDFGLVSDARMGAGETLTNEICGTPAYMAPELALGGAAQPASDAYAIGVMLYEALAGQPPFTGTVPQVLLAKQCERAGFSAECELATPDDLRRLCLTLLATEVEQRPTLQAVIASCGGAERSPAPPPFSAAASADVVGRQRELESLWAAFRDSVGERASLVSVRGQSGIGKTELCGSFLSALEAGRHAVVLRARCHEHESLPFKALDPLIDALAHHLRRLPATEAAALLPRETYALTRLFPTLNRVAAIAAMPERTVRDAHELRRRAFSALLEWLARLRDRHPLVVYIDDLQWACADSLQAIRQLLVERAPPPLLFVLASRDDGPHQTVLQTARDNPGWTVHDLPLTRLSAEAASELANRYVAGTPLDAQALRAIAQEADGNPLLVRELSRFAARGDALAQPLSLSAVLRWRTSALTSGAQRLLQGVSLVGEPLALDVALEASGAVMPDVDQLREALLVRTGTNLKRGGRTFIECYHDRIREELKAAIDPETARLVAQALAAVLVRRPEPDHELLSRCLERSNDRDAAAHHALAAAREADRAMAFERAAQLYDTCLQLGSHDVASRLQLTIDLGTALENSGLGPRAAETFSRAAESTTGIQALDLRRRAAEQWLVTGHVEEGTQQLRAVYAALGIRLPVSQHAAGLLFAAKQLRERFRPSDAFAPNARQASPRDELKLRALRTGSMGLMALSPPHCGCVSSDYLTLSFQVAGPADRVRGIGFLAYLLGQIDPHGPRARQLARSMIELAEQAGGAELLGISSMIQGTHALFAGDPGARTHFARALKLLAECHGVHWELDACHFHDQYSAFHCGDFAELARTGPALIQECLRRGRYVAAGMLMGLGVTAWLVPDDVAAGRRQLQEVRARWRDSGEASWPQFMLTLGEALLHLYSGEGRAAFELLERHRAGLGAALLSRRASGLRAHNHARLCCIASMLAAARRANDSAGRIEIAGTLRSALDEGRRWKKSQRRRPVFEQCQAALELDAGQAAQAAIHLKCAIELFERMGSRMHAAATLRRYGALLGEQGRDALGRGDAAMRAEGVENIEAMTEFLCPGVRP